MEPVISLSNITVSYGVRKSWFRKDYKTVLEGIDLELYKGESLGIWGGNGQGKSTLLRVLAGIYEPDSGSITSLTKSVSLLSLNVGFDQNLSGKDNAFLSSVLSGVERAVAERNLLEIKEYSELGDYFEESIKYYSSGMKARLGFATAITIDSDVLLIDETLSVGDRAFRKKAMETIKSIIDSGRTVVLVAHSKEKLLKSCSRVLTLKGGRLWPGLDG